MAEFINVTKDDKNVFLNKAEIQRISFERSDKVRQSERIANVVFVDGTNGSYVAHRNTEKAFYTVQPEQTEE